MTIFNRRSPIGLDSEVIAAIWLILLFGGFILLNFISGFNLFVWVVAAVFGLILPIIQPRAGFYALTFLTLIFSKFFTLQSLVINQVEYKFYLVDIIFCAIIIGLLLHLAKGKLKINWQWPDTLLVIWLFLVGLYFILSITSWQGAFAASFSSFKNYAFYPLFYFAAYLLISHKQQLKTWLGFVAAGAVSILGFIAYGLISGQGLWTDITPLSTAGARILDFDHAFYLCLISLFGLVYLVFKKGAANRWLYAWLPLAAIGIIGSLMRHLWLALVAAALSLYWLLPKAKRALCRQVLASYGAIVIMLLIVAVFIINILPFSGLAHTYQTAVGDLGLRAVSLASADDSSIAWRSAVWQSVWEKFKGNVVGGLGFGQQVFIDMGSYRDYVEIRDIHNSWLAIGVQLGAVGLALIAFFGWGIFYKLFKYKSSGGSGAAAKFTLLGLIIFCAVAFLFQPYLEANWFSIPFWLSLGLAKRTYEGAFS
jgi:O-antigen ligase